MIELLAKKQRRQMRLLETLIREKRWFHLKELAEMLDCTERSLKEDLSNLRTVFNEFLIESSTNGIKIAMTIRLGLRWCTITSLKNLQLSPSWNTCSSIRMFPVT